MAAADSYTMPASAWVVELATELGAPPSEVRLALSRILARRGWEPGVLLADRPDIGPSPCSPPEAGRWIGSGAGRRAQVAAD